MQLANADQELDELRVSPAQLEQLDQLVERYCGSRRLSVASADVLLSELGAQLASEWAARSVHVRSSWPPDAPDLASRQRASSSSPPSGSFNTPPPAAGSSRPSARFHKSPTLTGLGVASSVPPPDLDGPPPPEPREETTFVSPGGGLAAYDEDEETVPAAESPSQMLNGAVSAWSRSWSSAPAPSGSGAPHPPGAAPEPDGASSRPPPAPSSFGMPAERPRSLTPASSARPSARQFSSRPPLTAAEVPPIFELPEPKDGPLTQRMNARELRTSGRPAFAGGLVGADDLPEFPARTPQPPRNPEKPGAPAPQTASAPSDPPDGDNFEILVDEEILEIEPDDPLIEEI